jgi:hypothetical protein
MLVQSRRFAGCLLLVPDWLLLPEQAVQLLGVFDK